MKNKTLYRVFHLCSIIIILTSLILWIIKEFYQIETPYGLRPHPSTSFLIHLHVLLVPILTMLLGVMIFEHSIKKLKEKFKIKSGIVLIITSILMIFTGYGLQILVDLKDRSLMSTYHLVISFIWITFYIRHGFFQKKRS